MRGLVTRRVARWAAIAAVAAAGCDTSPHLLDTGRLGNTFDQQGPYAVRSVVGGTERPGGMTLAYQVAELDRVELQMTEVEDRNSRVYEASIPGQPAFTQVRFHVELHHGHGTTTDPSDVADGVWFGFWVLGLPCTDPVECGPGETCHLPSGACRALEGPCAVDRDCGKGRQCEDQRCQLAVRSCGACTLDEVCSPVTGDCIPRPRCDDGFACPLDFLCDGTSHRCLRVCVDHAECNRDELCGAGLCRRR